MTKDATSFNFNHETGFSGYAKPSTPLLGMTLRELKDVATNLQLPKFTYKQIAKWMYEKCVNEFSQMTDISKENREKMQNNCILGTAKPIKTLVSIDKTEKYLFPTLNGLEVETVLIPDKDRQTLCVSSQVGCKMNCYFCQTGKQGFQGNLSTAEILAQIQWAIREKNISNIVIMGQGEPSDNFDNIVKAMNIMTHKEAFAWSPKRITISTVALKKNFAQLIEQTQCNIAVSLHASYHEQRLQIMPAERQFNIEQIVETIRHYDFAHQRRLSFEYILFDNYNDSIDDAKRLIKMLRGIQCRINLIRFHKIPGVELNGADDDKILSFRDYLTSHGIFATVRASRGEDIMAACGMLTTAKKQ